MTITHRHGDIFTSEKPVIGHGVNMEGVMGFGIAKTVRQLFPSVDRDYRRAILAGDLKAGSVILSPALEQPGLRIANISSQIKRGRNAELSLLRSGLVELLGQLEKEGSFSLALPRIGAGIGGLDWDTEVLPLIEEMDKLYGGQFDIELWTFSG